MSDDKNIFRYQLPDGTEAAADPLRVRRRLSRLLNGQTAKAVVDFNSPDFAVSEASYDRLAAAVCEAFGLGAPFDAATGQGVLERHWLPVWNSFQEYLAGEPKTPA